MKLHEVDLRRSAGTGDRDMRTLDAQFLGARFGREFRRTALLYRTFYSTIDISSSTANSIAQSCFRALENWHPPQAAELRTIADVAGLKLVDLMSVCARTEILTAQGAHPRSECSTAIVPGFGGLKSIQTWDWHEQLVPDALIRHHQSDGGLSVTTFTEFGAPAKIGINSAGLAMNFNILHHRSDHTAGGVPVHAIARRILDEARSAEDAVAIAESARPSASTVLSVFDQDTAVSIEISPEGVAAVAPQTGGSLIHTNHFLDPTLALGENTPDQSTTFSRFEHLRSVTDALSVVSSNTSDMALRLAVDTREGTPASVCMSPDRSLPAHEQWSTLLTVVLDPVNRSMVSCPDRPDRWDPARSWTSSMKQVKTPVE